MPSSRVAAADARRGPRGAQAARARCGVCCARTQGSHWLQEQPQWLQRRGRERRRLEPARVAPRAARLARGRRLHRLRGLSPPKGGGETQSTVGRRVGATVGGGGRASGRSVGAGPGRVGFVPRPLPCSQTAPPALTGASAAAGRLALDAAAGTPAPRAARGSQPGVAPAPAPPAAEQRAGRRPPVPPPRSGAASLCARRPGVSGRAPTGHGRRCPRAARAAARGAMGQELRPHVWRGDRVGLPEESRAAARGGGGRGGSATGSRRRSARGNEGGGGGGAQRGAAGGAGAVRARQGADQGARRRVARGAGARAAGGRCGTGQ